MTIKIKEKLVKWSRHAKTLQKISRFCAYILIIVFVPVILCDICDIFDIGFKLFSQYIYSIFFKILVIGIIVGTCIFTIKSVLYAIKNNTENIYKNKLVYVLLSEEDVVWSIITILFIVLFVIFGSKHWLNIIWLILIWILPGKVSKHFRNKLLK